jgi:hypothetical protein
VNLKAFAPQQQPQRVANIRLVVRDKHTMRM